ncbi:hypothetical protein NX02_10955 [Sphingomonas sanxanigenens DSM 19645 = NX02]|uniref:Uncharacterized protein n=1 Tax=Sphingomonas sanxanigenens DSM 19645 = NX02 TaxID=1123269 RepID=W0A7I8_9SPHN|nr:hypothetical protein NX02_10955 [Sphingomonas sanxanigenens DSM 19645 = NX02]
MTKEALDAIPLGKIMPVAPPVRALTYARNGYAFV